MRLLLSLLFISILTGCASYQPLVPDGYRGEVATIDDSFKKDSSSKADLFFIRSINGNEIQNALTNTIAASEGQGFRIAARGKSRHVPAEKLRIRLVGQVHHSAPIGYLFGNYSASSD